MGRDHTEEISRGTRQVRKKPDPKTNGLGITSYHPTTEERERLKAGAMDLSKAVEALAGLVGKGAKVTLGHRAENDSYYAIIREEGDNWQESAAVSYWHSEPDKALIGLAFGLAVRFPAFPDMPPTQLRLGADW